MAKSTMDVVPPCAAASVPVSKSSLDVVPPNGMSRCVCASMPPGRTYLPVASMVVSHVPAGRGAGAKMAAIFPSTMATSAAYVSTAVTTVPPCDERPCHGARHYDADGLDAIRSPYEPSFVTAPGG